MHVVKRAALSAVAAGMLLGAAAPSPARAACSCEVSGGGSCSCGPSCSCPSHRVPSTSWIVRYALPASVAPGSTLSDPTLAGPGGAALGTSMTLGVSLARGWMVGPKATVEAEGVFRRLDVPAAVAGGKTTTVNGKATFTGAFVNAILEPIELTGVPFVTALVPRVGGGLGWGWVGTRADGLVGKGDGVASQLIVGVRAQLDPRTSVAADYRAIGTEKLLVQGVPIGQYQSRTFELELQVAL